MKPQIALVVGDYEGLRALRSFVSLGKHVDFIVCMFHQKKAFESMHLPFQVRAYESVPEMPGFMRGLESDLSTCDSVITFDTTSLHSYQVLKACQTHQIPCAVYSREICFEQYVDHKHVHGMHSEILNKADFFLTPCTKSKQALLDEGVEEQRLYDFPVVVDPRLFALDDKRREKFRGYLGISKEEVVLLIEAPLIKGVGCEYVLSALVEVDDLHVIFVGQGPNQENLKYQAYDLGVGGRVFFLHQDASHFLPDLYNSADLALCFAPKVGQIADWSFGSRYPYAVSCGVIPILEPCVTYFEWDPHVCVSLTDVSAESLVHKIQEIRRQGLVHKRMEVATCARSVYAPRIAHGNLLDVLCLSASVDKENDTKLLEKLQRFSQKKAWNTILRTIETLDLEPMRPAVYSQVLAFAGDAYRQLGFFDESSEEYGKSLDGDENNLTALCGLGLLGLYTHSYEESSMFFSRAIGVSVNYAPALTGMALLSLRLGATHEAVHWMERSLLTQVDDCSLQMYVQMIRECEDERTAIASLERAVDLIGQEDILLRALQQKYVESGQSEKAQNLEVEAYKL